MPIEKTPLKSPAFPPKNAAAHRVQSGETWGTIATARNVPVLDLIRFNFGTADPAEINFFLRTLVGCVRTTFDKKNWMFSDDATPGKIYYPAKAPAPPGAMPEPPLSGAAPLPAGVLASESDVTAGPLRVNDAYDLKLSRLPGGHYELLCFMKLQFFFNDGSGGSWAKEEKKKFMNDWETAVKTAWGGRIVKTLPVSKKQVLLRFAFSLQEGGWMFDHWEITVTKIKAGTFRTSYVQPSLGNVTLDSEDLTPVNKGGDGGCMQRGAVHEFGHMLGLDDEYNTPLAAGASNTSMMHSCEIVNQTHTAPFMKWLDKQIAGLGLD